MTIYQTVLGIIRTKSYGEDYYDIIRIPCSYQFTTSLSRAVKIMISEFLIVISFLLPFVDIYIYITKSYEEDNFDHINTF